MNRIVTTEIFKVAPGSYMQELMRLWLRHNAWWLALPEAVLIGLVWIDIRFAFVALIYLFLIVPPVMMTVYFYHALSPTSRMSVALHSVEVDSNGLTITYAPTDESDTPDISAAPTPTHIAGRSIRLVATRRRHAVLRVDTGRYSILIVPYNAFTSTDDLREFMKLIINFNTPKPQ